MVEMKVRNKEVVRLYRRGLGAPAIAKQIGLTRQRVGAILKFMGVTMRTWVEAKALRDRREKRGKKKKAA